MLWSLWWPRFCRYSMGSMNCSAEFWIYQTSVTETNEINNVFEILTVAWIIWYSTLMIHPPSHSNYGETLVWTIWSASIQFYHYSFGSMNTKHIMITQHANLPGLVHIAKLSCSQIKSWVALSLLVVRPSVRPASVTSPLISTIWCFRPYKPYIFWNLMTLSSLSTDSLTTHPSPTQTHQTHQAQFIIIKLWNPQSKCHCISK